MTSERLEERGRALWVFERAGGSTARLVRLDRLVREGRRTDWPARRTGQPEWRADPAIPGPGRWVRRGWCPDCGREDCTDPKCEGPA